VDEARSGRHSVADVATGDTANVVGA